MKKQLPSIKKTLGFLFNKNHLKLSFVLLGLSVLLTITSLQAANTTIDFGGAVTSGSLASGTFVIGGIQFVVTSASGFSVVQSGGALVFTENSAAGDFLVTITEEGPSAFSPTSMYLNQQSTEGDPSWGANIHYTLYPIGASTSSTSTSPNAAQTLNFLWPSGLQTVSKLTFTDTEINGVAVKSKITLDSFVVDLSPILPNDPPTDISLSNSAVAMSGGVNATIGTLSTTDSDDYTVQTHTYSLVSGTGSTDNSSFNISGTTLRANNAATMAEGTYSVRVRTTDQSNATFEKVFSITVTTYPPVSINNPNDNEYNYITNVTLGSINNTSTQTGTNQLAYEDYTAQSTDLALSSTTLISVSIGGSDIADSPISAFIDWNQDKDFDDLNEVFIVLADPSAETGTSAGPITTDIVVPPGAIVGQTRMRVVTDYSRTPLISGIIDYGEAEDYTINVVGSSSNTAPTAASFTASNIYEGTSYTFATANFSYSDGDGDPLDHLRVAAIPANGSLWIDVDGSGTINGGELAITNGVTVSKANLDAGYLKYLNTNGTSSSFTFDVNDGTDYSASTYTATLTVIAEPTVTLSLSPSSSISENTGSTNVTATLSHGFNKTVSVNLSKTGTTASSDYNLSASIITITAGNTSNYVTLTAVEDAIDEQDETVILDIVSVTNGSESGIQQVTCTLLDNDASAVTIADISGNENDGVITVTATLDNAVQGGFTVDVSTSDGTATTADSDYTAVTSQTLTFAGTAGETQTFTVTPTADNKLEANETITISQSNLAATGLAVVITDGATVTINNDDASALTIADISGNENDGAITVTATLDNAVQGGFTVDVSTSDGTATTADSDYTAVVSQTLIFAGTAGETETFMVTPTGDSKLEPNETLTVSQSNLAATTLGVVITDVASITIANDDAAPIITTQAVSNITASAATGNGNINNLGTTNPSAHGMCWNTTGSPTIADSKSDEGARSTLGAFTSNLSSLSPRTTYYVKAYATNESGTSYGNQVSFTTDYGTTVWNGTTNNRWDEASNWSNGVPTAGHNVSIPNGVTTYPLIFIGRTENANSIELAPEAELTLMAASILNVNQPVVIQSDASNSGSLLSQGTINIVSLKDSQFALINVIYKRYEVGDQWHLFSSPVSLTAIAPVLATVSNGINNDGTNYDLKSYDEANDAWSSLYTTSTTDVFTSGIAYAIKRNGDGIISLPGLYFNDPVSLPLSSSGNGWNLFGNPYTGSMIINVLGNDGDYLLNTANVDELDPAYAAVYIWEENTADPTNTNNYKYVNSALTGNLSATFIAVGQGFFVKAKSGATSFGMNTQMCQHRTHSAIFKEEQESWPSIRLKANSESASAFTELTFNDAMTKGLDIAFDAGLLTSNPSFSLYSRLVEDYQATDFMLQALPKNYDNLVVPIGLDAKANEIVKFSIEASNLAENYNVVFEDRMLNTFTNLSESDYSIQLNEATSGVGRFYLHTVAQLALGFDALANDAFQVFAQANQQKLIIRGDVEANTRARVYNISGQLMADVSLKQEKENEISFNAETGVYLVQISNAKGVYTEKISWVK